MNLYLAPMEDVTDPAFRMLCKRYGADRVYTEFVNADALVRDIASTTRKLTIHDEEPSPALIALWSAIWPPSSQFSLMLMTKSERLASE